MKYKIYIPLRNLLCALCGHPTFKDMHYGFSQCDCGKKITD